jgi:hypothetical protein
MGGKKRECCDSTHLRVFGPKFMRGLRNPHELSAGQKWLPLISDQLVNLDRSSSANPEQGLRLALPDPRVDRTKRHGLLDLVVIALCAVICGAEGWEDMESFRRAKEPWLRVLAH